MGPGKPGPQPPLLPAVVTEALRESSTAVREALQGSERLLEQNEQLRQETARIRREDVQLLDEDEHMRQEDERLLDEDARLRSEDARLRQEDDELRRQNAQIRRTLQHMAFDDVPTLALGVLGQPIHPVGANATAFRPHRTTGWVGPFLAFWSLALSVGLLIAYKVYDFMQDSGNDLDGDGNVDFRDFWRHCSCGLSNRALRNMFLVFVFAVAGFCFLWWLGVMQPFLGQLTVYAYLLLTVVGFASIFLAEVWSDLSGSAMGLFDVISRVERFFHNTNEGLHEAVERAENLVHLHKGVD